MKWITSLTACACLFAGGLVMLDSNDASAAFKRLGPAYCGLKDAQHQNNGSSDENLNCAIPSDDDLEHADIAWAAVFLVQQGSTSMARACAQDPLTINVACSTNATASSAAAATLLLDGIQLNPWVNNPLWFPYIRVTLGPGSIIHGIKISD